MRADVIAGIILQLPTTAQPDIAFNHLFMESKMKPCFHYCTFSDELNCQTLKHRRGFIITKNTLSRALYFPITSVRWGRRTHKSCGEGVLQAPSPWQHHESGVWRRGAMASHARAPPPPAAEPVVAPPDPRRHGGAASPALLRAWRRRVPRRRRQVAAERREPARPGGWVPGAGGGTSGRADSGIGAGAGAEIWPGSRRRPQTKGRRAERACRGPAPCGGGGPAGAALGSGQGPTSSGAAVRRRGRRRPCAVAQGRGLGLVEGRTGGRAAGWLSAAVRPLSAPEPRSRRGSEECRRALQEAREELRAVPPGAFVSLWLTVRARGF